MWIPDPIYQKLPFAYAVAGVGLLAEFGLYGPTLLSAVLLFAAAIMTLRWRAMHRAAAEPDPTTILREQWEDRRARRIESMRFDQH